MWMWEETHLNLNLSTIDVQVYKVMSDMFSDVICGSRKQ